MNQSLFQTSLAEKHLLLLQHAVHVDISSHEGIPKPEGGGGNIAGTRGCELTS